MAQIKILDTGFVSNETRATQTQLSDANRAGYTGSAVTSFTLKNSGVSLGTSVNIEQKPIINSLTDNDSSLISVGQQIYSVNFILEKDIVTAGWDVNNLVQIMRLDRTYGLKLMYMTATGDTIPTIVEAMGQVNTGGNFSDASPSDDNGTVSTTTPYLLGRVRNLRVSDSATNNTFWRISFDFVVSA